MKYEIYYYHDFEELDRSHIVTTIKIKITYFYLFDTKLKRDGSLALKF